MALPFPHRPDVPLGNAPLAEVICQIRFSPILRIGKEEPGEFQERVRRRFPGLEVEHGLLVGIPGIASSAAPAPFAEPQAKVYRFRSADGQTALSLAVDFYALSTTRYTHWQDFASDLALAHEAVEAIYDPAYASRIGLRYINRFNPESSQRATIKEVLGLFRSELVALLGGELWDNTASHASHFLLRDGDARLTLRFGYRTEEPEPFFILDLDYYEEGQLPLDDLLGRCHRFHASIYDAFRWCLREEALEVFRPTHVPEESK